MADMLGVAGAAAVVGSHARKGRREDCAAEAAAHASKDSPAHKPSHKQALSVVAKLALNGHQLQLPVYFGLLVQGVGEGRVDLGAMSLACSAAQNGVEGMELPRTEKTEGCHNFGFNGIGAIL